MNDRPNSLKRLGDEEVLNLIKRVTAEAVLVQSAKVQSRLQILLDGTAARFSDCLMHPDEEPNWAVLEEAQGELEAWFIVLDLFVQNQHLAEKALAYFQAVSSGLSSLRRLWANSHPQRPANFVDEGPHPLPNQIERDAPHKALSPLAQIQKQLAQIQIDWYKASNRYSNQMISSLEYGQQLRELMERLNALPDLGEARGLIQNYRAGMEQELHEIVAVQRPDPWDEDSEAQVHNDELNRVSDEEPDAQGEDPFEVDNQDIKLIWLDVEAADNQLLTGEIFYTVWRERMMQLFERAKRTIPLDNPHRHGFLSMVLLPRLSIRSGDEAKQSIRAEREQVRVAQVQARL